MKGNPAMNTKKSLVLMVAAGLALTSLSACGSSGDQKADSSASPAASAASSAASSAPAADSSKDTAGIKEIPVGDSGPQTKDALTVDVVYFQAIDMEQGSTMVPPASQSDMHFEVDVSTNEKATEWGYEKDQFLPYLDVKAVATDKKTGKKIDLGTMMPMIASDGPHYGNNIKLPAGNYDVTITIASPADKFMLHTGKDSSGVKGRFWKQPLTFQFDNWQWDGQLL
jgi:uncharacterized protein involved in high-affinity Fe2+ transport